MILMFHVDISLLASILAPLILVSFLIIVKIKQEETSRRLCKASNSQTIKRASEFQEETRQDNCPQYFGYLHDIVRPHPLFKMNPEKSSFPKQCYGCPKLIECFYSPTIVERIYGNEDEKLEQTL